MVAKRLLFFAGLVFLLMSLSACDFTLYIAHYAKMAGWATTVSVQNPHAVDVTIDVYAYDDAGHAAASKTNIPIAARGFYSNLVQNIFAPAAIPDTGSLRIVCHEPESGTVPKMSAVALFDYAAGPSLGGLQSFSNPSHVIHFPWFDNTPPNMTGLTVLNTNPFSIQVVLKAYAESGTPYTSLQTYTLAPFQKLAGYPANFFSSSLPDKTTVSAYASGNIAGFMILHNNTVQKVEAINGVPDAVGSPAFSLTPGSGPATNSAGRKMVFSSDGNFLFIRTLDGWRSYNRQTNAIIKSSTSWFDGDVALYPTGFSVFISDTTDDKIYSMAIPTSSSAVYPAVERVSFTDPIKIAVSRDGHYLGATSLNEYRIWDITDNYSLVASGNFVGGMIQDCTFSNDSRYFLFTNGTDLSFYRHDLVGGTLNHTVLTDFPRNIAQSDYNDYYYISSSASKVMLVNPNTFAQGSSLTVNGGQYYLCMAQDGRTLYIPTWNTNTVYAYDITSSHFIEDNYDLTTLCYPAVLTPEGDRLYFGDWSGGGYTIRWVN